MARSAPCVYKRGAALPVIAHLDVDCFYCQVEHRRLGIPRDEPLVVQQWESVVAVNYAARRLGIRRGDKCAPLLKKWPQLHAVHVDVLQVNEGEKGVVLSEQTQQELPGQICRRPAGPPPPASNSSTAADPYQGGCLAEENFSSSFPKGEVRVQQATTRKVVRGCPRKFVPVDVSFTVLDSCAWSMRVYVLLSLPHVLSWVLAMWEATMPEAVQLFTRWRGCG